MNLYLEDFLEGMRETIALHKKGENIFDMGNGNIFPTLNSQQRWRYARSNNRMHLSDGQRIYSFEFPGDHKEDEESHISRVPDLSHHDFEKLEARKVTAQVHRADPGSIYFTVQEGSKNPTYTMRHVGGPTWKMSPKIKKAKQPTQPPVAIPDQHAEAVKQGMAREMLKAAGFFDNAQRFAGQMIPRGLNLGVDTILAPGRNPLAAAGIGAGLGAAYHYGKKHLYNTPEENEQEKYQSPLKKILMPAAALGGLGLLQRQFFKKPDGTGYYNRKAEGVPTQIFPTPTKLINPFTGQPMFNK